MATRHRTPTRLARRREVKRLKRHARNAGLSLRTYARERAPFAGNEISAIAAAWLQRKEAM